MSRNTGTDELPVEYDVLIFMTAFLDFKWVKCFLEVLTLFVNPIQIMKS